MTLRKAAFKAKNGTFFSQAFTSASRLCRLLGQEKAFRTSWRWNGLQDIVMVPIFLSEDKKMAVRGFPPADKSVGGGRL